MLISGERSLKALCETLRVLCVTLRNLLYNVAQSYTKKTQSFTVTEYGNSPSNHYLCNHNPAKSMLNYQAVNRSVLLIIQTALILMLLNSCTEKEDKPDYYINTPIAGFSWTGNDGPAPVTVQFINTSQNADQFEWNFDDGQVSSARDPIHTFNNGSNEPVNRLIVLKATDSSSGLFQRISKVIVIQPQN